MNFNEIIMSIIRLKKDGQGFCPFCSRPLKKYSEIYRCNSCKHDLSVSEDSIDFVYRYNDKLLIIYQYYEYPNFIIYNEQGKVLADIDDILIINIDKDFDDKLEMILLFS